MNKSKIDELIPEAYEALSIVEIARDNKINKAFKGQIATLGAAIIMGSLMSAVAYFMDNGQAKVKRNKILQAIWVMLEKEYATKVESNDKKPKDKMQYALELFQKIKDTKKEEETVLKNNILESLLAIKLAMNLYEMEGDDGEK